MCQRQPRYPQSKEWFRICRNLPDIFTKGVATPIMPSMTDAEAEERRRLLETEIERRLAERFAALRDEFDRLRLETDRRWFGFLEKFDQDLKGVVPGELLPAGESAAPGAPRPPGSVSIGAAPVSRFLKRREPEGSCR